MGNDLPIETTISRGFLVAMFDAQPGFPARNRTNKFPNPSKKELTIFWGGNGRNTRTESRKCIGNLVPVWSLSFTQISFKYSHPRGERSPPGSLGECCWGVFKMNGRQVFHQCLPIGISVSSHYIPIIFP